MRVAIKITDGKSPMEVYYTDSEIGLKNFIKGLLLAKESGYHFEVSEIKSVYKSLLPDE